MANLIRTIAIETIRGGQPRPYADSYYEAVITYGGGIGAIGFDPTEEIVKKHIKAVFHDFYEKDKKEWYQPYLEKLEKVDVGKWRVLIIEPYLD